MGGDAGMTLEGLAEDYQEELEELRQRRDLTASEIAAIILEEVGDDE